MKGKKIISLLSLIILMFCLAACGVREAADDNDQQGGKIPAGEQAVFPMTVVGSDGKEIVLEEEPLRIISISPSVTEIISSLGMLDKLIARSDYCDYPAEVLDVPSIGTLFSPDVERIIELEPDLVITSAHFSEDSQAGLDALGIKVLTLYEEHTFDGVYTMFDILGKLMGVSETADGIILQMKEEMAEISDKIKDVEPKTVYYAVGFGEWGDYTAGGDTYVHDLLKLAGAVNIAGDVSGWVYSLEAIIEAEPDYIILGEYSYEEFIHTKPYDELGAVLNGNVIVIDNNKLDRQSYRNVEAVREIAEALYKEAFADE